MKDPRKPSCVTQGHLFDRLSITCRECPEKTKCWLYTGWKLGFTADPEVGV